jgi:hypothetical protein
MEVFDRKQLLFSVINPQFLIDALATGTMTISTTMHYIVNAATIPANHSRTAKFGGTARRKCPQGL